MSDLIDRQAAIDALWKALFYYEDKAEKQFQESDELDVSDWILHRIFVQNMNDIDRQILQELPSAQPKKQVLDEIYGMMKDYYFKHRNDHDDSWQGGFAKCMNLIPNMYERREDG